METNGIRAFYKTLNSGLMFVQRYPTRVKSNVNKPQRLYLQAVLNVGTITSAS